MAKGDRKLNERGLTPKQEIFVKEYMRDFNATRAALEAGYSKRTAAAMGNENLQKPEIKAALEEERNKLTTRIEVTQDMVIRQLAKIAFADITDYVEFDNDGKKIKLKPGTKIDGTVIQSISDSQNGINLKLNSREKALETLSKYFGISTENIKIEGEMTNNVNIERPKLKDMIKKDNGDKDGEQE